MIIVLQFPMIIRFLVQRPFNNIFCATLDICAATLFNLVLGENYSIVKAEFAHPVSTCDNPIALQIFMTYFDLINQGKK